VSGKPYKCRQNPQGKPYRNPVLKIRKSSKIAELRETWHGLQYSGGRRKSADTPMQTELRTDREIASRLGVPVSSVQIARFDAWRNGITNAQYRATPIDRNLSQENSCDAAESEE
jgi:hypothetical protein